MSHNPSLTWFEQRQRAEEGPRGPRQSFEHSPVSGFYVDMEAINKPLVRPPVLPPVNAELRATSIIPHK